MATSLASSYYDHETLYSRVNLHETHLMIFPVVVSGNLIIEGAYVSNENQYIDINTAIF